MMKAFDIEAYQRTYLSFHNSSISNSRRTYLTRANNSISGSVTGGDVVSNLTLEVNNFFYSIDDYVSNVIPTPVIIKP